LARHYYSQRAVFTSPLDAFLFETVSWMTGRASGRCWCWQTRATRLEVSQSTKHRTIPHVRLGIVSSCAIVTLSLRRAVFLIFDFKKCRDLQVRVKGHSRSLKVVPFDRLCMISY